MNVSDINKNAIVHPVKPNNRVKEFTKNEDGSMTCTQFNGNIFTLDKDDKEMQTFIVASMITNGFTLPLSQ